MLSNETGNSITVEEDTINTAKPVLNINGQNSYKKVLIFYFVKIRVMLPKRIAIHSTYTMIA